MATPLSLFVPPASTFMMLCPISAQPPIPPQSAEATLPSP
jgi:hypothetical protein